MKINIMGNSQIMQKYERETHNYHIYKIFCRIMTKKHDPWLEQDHYLGAIQQKKTIYVFHPPSRKTRSIMKVHSKIGWVARHVSHKSGFKISDFIITLKLKLFFKLMSQVNGIQIYFATFRYSYLLKFHNS